MTCDTGVQSRTAFCATAEGASESVEICRLIFPSFATERTCNPGACQGTVVDTFFYQTSPNGAVSSSSCTHFSNQYNKPRKDFYQGVMFVCTLAVQEQLYGYVFIMYNDWSSWYCA